MRTRKMTLEVIIIVIGIIAGILAALAIRFAYSIHDWAELTEELQSENDALRAEHVWKKCFVTSTPQKCAIVCTKYRR